MRRIYFDYASTTPTDTEVVKAIQPFFYEKFGNASSPHTFGREAQAALEGARETLGRFIGANADEIVFTSGATESNNHAIFGLARSLKDRGNHIVVSSIEHHSVLEPVALLKKEGFAVTYLSVDHTGVVDPSQIKSALTNKTIFIAVMHASNEIGAIQPIAEIGKIVRASNIPFLVDGVQTVGHVPVNVDELGADFLSLSAHKFYGPKGIGALYIRRKTKVSSFLLGGDQERERRASTQNVAGCVGLARAVELCEKQMDAETKIQTAFRDQLLTEVSKRIDGVIINGHLKNRLPNNAHFSFEKIEGESLLMSLDMEGIAASMGSACTSGAMEPSHVLRAIGLPDELAYGSLRLTTGRWTRQEDIDYLLDQLPKIIKRLRS